MRSKIWLADRAHHSKSHFNLIERITSQFQDLRSRFFTHFFQCLINRIDNKLLLWIGSHLPNHLRDRDPPGSKSAQFPEWQVYELNPLFRKLGQILAFRFRKFLEIMHHLISAQQLPVSTLMELGVASRSKNQRF